MELAEAGIAKSAHARQQHLDRLQRGKGADPSRHRAQHAVIGAGVAILGIEGIAEEAAVAGLARQVSGKGRDLALKPAHCGRKQRMPAATLASDTARRVAKLSVPSSTRSQAPISPAALPVAIRASDTSTLSESSKFASQRRAETALPWPTSRVVKIVWR